MVGQTLADISARLDELAVAVGPYRVVSARSGDGPFPVTGRQFPDRETAAEAATVAAAYRRALRRYDPHVTVQNLIVTETRPGGPPRADPPQSLPEYCHTVAGALFESLADRHGPVERTVMDTYLGAAETTENRERLCLELVESTATALDEQLTTDEQATVIRAASRRLPHRETATEPLAETLASLQSTGVVESATVEPVPDGPGRRSQRVSLDGYQPSLSGDRCPVLPVVVELLRRTTVLPHVTDVTRTQTGWELVVSMAGDSPAGGLAVVSTRT